MALVLGAPTLVLSTQVGAVTITDLMVLPGGAFEIVWDTASTVSGPAVHQTTYEIFDATGAPISGQVAAGTYSGSGQVPSHLQQSLQLSDGTTLKLSTVFDTYSPARFLVLQQFDANGTPLGDPIDTGIGDAATGGIAQLSNGDVVFVAESVSKTGVEKIWTRVLDNTAADTTAPVATDFFPAAGSSMLPPDWNLAITFDETVKAGSGTITLETAAGQVVQTFAAATDPGIRFNGSSVIIDPAADLQPGTTYKLVVSPDAVQDLAGNAYGGESGYAFTTAGSAPPPDGDTTAPVAVDFFPAAGSTLFPPDWNLGITFSEDVKAGAGTITLRTAAGEVVQTFATATDPGIHFIGSSLVIDPAADLRPGTTYQLVVEGGAIVDTAGNAYAGESGYTFTTAGSPAGTPDTTPPAVVDYSPPQGSHTLPLDGNISITFDEPVKAGAGTIVLATVPGRTSVQHFVAASDPGIHFVGSTLVIDPAANLQEGTQYEVIVYRDAVEDLAGNPYGVDAGVPPGPIASRYTFFTDGPILLGRFPEGKIPLDWNMSLTFNETVKAGAGTITLQTAAGEVVQTFATATDPGVQFSGSNVIINPAADLQPGTTYRLIVSPDAVEDLAGIAYSGITFPPFTATASSDIVAPRPTGFIPAPDSSTLPPDSNLSVTFDEAVKAGSGTITLQTAGGQVVQTFTTATDPGIHFSGATLVIDPVNNLQPGVQYGIFFGPDAIEDLAGNSANIIPNYFFTTASQVPTAVTLVGTPDQPLTPA